VADFGLSKTKELSCTYTDQSMDVGTTRWMAPELFGDPEFQNAGPSSLRDSDLSFKVSLQSWHLQLWDGLL
jgi:serine/threonine protein kinase